jgi:LPS export ABC transporter protein LptC
MKHLRIFALVLLLATIGCGNDEKLPTLPTKISSDVLSESYNVQFDFSELGHLKARLKTGKVLEKLEGEKENAIHIHYFKKGVKLEFYDVNGNLETTLTSDEGQLNKEKGLADLKGNVVAVGKEGARLECDQLFWDEKQDKIFTNGWVRVQSPSRTLEGEGFESNTSLTRYRIFKAKGQVSVQNTILE